MREYESPKAFKLDEVDSMYGNDQHDCDPGSSASSCGPGMVAAGACANEGTAAGTQCPDGNQAQLKCDAQGSNAT